MANLVELNRPSAGGSSFIIKGNSENPILLSSETSKNIDNFNTENSSMGPNLLNSVEAATNVSTSSSTSSPNHQKREHRNDENNRGIKSNNNNNEESGSTAGPAPGVADSGQSSPGGSINSMSNSSTAATSDESVPRRSFSRNCYNSTPEQEESDNEDDLEQLMRLQSEFEKVSVSVQTDYDEDFPPLKFLRPIADDNPLTSMPMLFDIPEQQLQPIQPSSMVSIVPSSASPSDLAASCSNSADGTLQLVIQNFPHMSDTVRGPSKFVQGVPWRIMVMPRQHVVQKKGTQKCLGFFLQCCPDAYSESWSCQASAELRLISQKQGVPNFTRKTNHVYTAKENDWGYSCFMTWADILDEAQGYIKDDKVILEVSVKADPPKNILTHKEFQKKIQDYKRLADMQCQRGLIDKAIECNLQALKFCKDKDIHCKIELETQKAHLIEMKLKQSIERIEKGSDATKTEDDAANLSALRHALGSNAARNATSKNNQAQKKGNTNIASKENDSNAAVKTITGANSTIVRSGTPSLPATPRNELSNQPNAEENHCNGGIDRQNPLSELINEPQNKTEQNDGIKKDIKTSKSKKKKGEFISTRNSSKNSDGGKLSSLSFVCSAGENCKGQLDSKALVALGHFNKTLLNSDDFDYVKERYREGEELLPDQIHSYFQQLSEKERDPKRLKRFSAEFELLSSSLDSGKRADAFLDELLKLAPKESEIFAAIDRELDECGHSGNEEKRVYKKASRRDFCDACLKSSDKNVVTAESSCQTEFLKCITQKVVDAAAHMIQLPQKQQNFQQQLPVVQQLHQQQQVHQLQHQQLSTIDWVNSNNNNNNVVQSPTLPTRQRKKATAKKSMLHAQQQNHQFQLQQQQQQFNQQQFNQQQQLIQQQQQMQQQFNAAMLPKANPRQSGIAGVTIGSNISVGLQSQVTLQQSCFPQTLLGTNNSVTDLKFGTTAPANMDMSLAALTAELEIGGKINEMNTALSLMGLNCANARKITQKLGQFLDTLESNPNLRELRICIERLASLLGEDLDTTFGDESVSVISVGESMRDLDHISYNEEDGQDCVVTRELRQAEVVMTNRLNTILFQLQSSSAYNLLEVVSRIELRIHDLEENEKISKENMDHAKQNENHLTKQINDLQKSLQSSNEKYDKLNQQLKERKNEIKKLEKKVKSEAQISAENVDLHEKVDMLKKEVSHLHRQINEEQIKYKRDTQSLADSKKHLQLELNNRYSEIQKLNSALDEKTQTLKKIETQLSNERRNNSSTISSLTERAKKAEINLLEHKLEDGLRVLERARDDCQMQIKMLEDCQKKNISIAESEVVEKNIKEWESKKEEVIVLINQAKSEFTAHINSIKNGGKQLSQLPKIQVPKPPPCPKLFPMPPKPTQMPQMQRISPVPNQAIVAALQQQQASNSSLINSNNITPSSPLPLERKAITPPSNRSRLGAASNGSATPQHSSINAMISPIPPTSNFTNAIPNSVNATPVKGVHDLPDTLNMLRDFHHSRALQLQIQRQSQQTQSPMTDSQVNLGGSTIAPIGVRPQNYQNGMAQQQKTMQHHQQQQPQQFFSHQHAQQSPSCFSASNNLAQTQSHMNHHMNHQQIPQQHMPYMSQSQQQQNKTSLLNNSISSTNCLNSSNNSGNIFQSWGGWGTDQLNNINELFGQGRSFGPLGSDFGGNSAARAANDNTKANFINSTANNGNVSNESNVFFP